MSQQRYTRQLRATWEVLAASKDHPTAEVVLNRVRRRLPRVSLATVYRNLDKLQGLGRVQVLRFDDGVAHYDADVSEHAHFVCDKCERVMDVAQVSSCVDVGMLECEGFVVRSRSVILQGCCPDCARCVEDEEKDERNEEMGDGTSVAERALGRA